MPNRLSVSLVLAALGGLACGTISQAPTPDVSPISTSAPQRQAPSAATATPRAASAVVGTLAQIGAGRLTVRSQDDRDAVLDLTDATRVTIDGRPATLADLHPGMAVRASCDAAWHVLAVDASRGSNAASMGSGTGG